MKEKNKKPVFLFLHFSLMFHYQNHLPSIHVSPKTHEIMRTGVCVSVYEWGEKEGIEREVGAAQGHVCTG